MRTCANCGRTIGNLETPYWHGHHVVCAECKQRLAMQVSAAPPPEQSPLDALAQATRGQYAGRPYYPPAARSSARRVWKNVSLLGLGMFAVGALLEVSGARACGYFGLIGLILWLVAGVVAISMKE